MLTVCWAAKGGSGTTVVSCALALLSAAAHGSSWLIDLAGDVPAALGLVEPAGPGVHDWIGSATAGLPAFEALGVPAAEGMVLIPKGAASPHANADSARWAELGQYLAACPNRVVVDAGSWLPPPQFLAAAQHQLLVIRPCYLALRKAVEQNRSTTGVILITGGDRVLIRRDVQSVLKTEVVAEIALDPEIARRVDSGLLHSRIPPALSAALSPLLTHLVSI